MDLTLHSDLIYENNLDTGKFSRMLDDPSQCYKFYWLEAILTLTAITDDDLTFDEIIDEMICAAWYSVTTYHLHLGPVIMGKSENFLEHAIKIIEKDPDLSAPASKKDLMAAIKRNNKELHDDKNKLTIYVPYRLLSSFLDEISGSDRIWDQHRRLIAYIAAINSSSLLPYTIIDGKGLKKRVRVNPYWRQLILDNYSVIKSWIKLKKVRFLQDRNPGVPGIIYKLDPENETVRKLNNARLLWKRTFEVTQLPVVDTYTGNVLSNGRFDLDHFVPWSYIANDELWNLTPMNGRLNSSKSNKLPDWDAYYPLLADKQYYLYKTVFSYDVVRDLFEKCRKENINAIWASESLYIEGNSEEQFKGVLEHNLKPIYELARLQGYGIWRL